MLPRLPLSVCMISGAEAQRIEPALRSVADLASEIVVVLNQDVHDGTEEIARRHGAQVFREPWKGFIAQKNSAADKTTQPWLLCLDADEVLSPELQREIARVVGSGAPPPLCAAYYFPRCTFYCERWIRHGDWYPDHQVRLWQRGRARWGGEDPHAKLVVDGPIGRLRSDLLHYSMESFDHQLAKTAQYSSEFVRQRAGSRGRPGFLDLAFRPAWRFFRSYVLKLGFLDGWPGYYIAWQNAFACMLRYAKLRESRSGPTRPHPQAGRPPDGR